MTDGLNVMDADDSEQEGTRDLQDASGPLVTVIVPVHNRRRFLPQLANTIASQTYKNVEVVIVDDGSNDGSAEWVTANRALFSAPLKLLRQANAGPYAARNHALRFAHGEYLAFLDSDDEWPAYHISDFVDVLQENSDVDWIFGSITRMRHDTGEIVEQSNFMPEGIRHPFLSLATEIRGEVRVVVDERTVEAAFEHGVPGSMQCALIRERIFRKMIFDESYRTAYDRFFAMEAVLQGFRFAWVEKVHQIYHVHNEHISMAAGGDTSKQILSAQTLLRGYRDLLPRCPGARERRALKRRMAAIYSWQLGEAYIERGQRVEAIQAKVRAFMHVPSLLYVKSTLATITKLTLKLR